MKKDGKKRSHIDSSLFLGGLNSFIAKISKAIADSAVFSSLRNAGDKLLSENSGVFAKLNALFKKANSPILSAKRAVARQFAESRFLGVLQRIKETLFSIPLRSYGIILFFFGAYGVAFSAADCYNSGKWYFEDPNLIASLIIVLVSVFFFFSAKPLIVLLCESSTFSSLLDNVVCVRTDEIRVEEKSQRISNFALMIGSLLGILTAAVPTLEILKYIGLAVFVLCLWRSPEFGLNVLILLFPFLKESELAVLAIGTFSSYFIKLIRGKRVLTKGFMGILPVLVGAIAIIRYFISPNGSPADFSLILSIPLVYIVAFNLLRSKKLLRTASDMVCISFYLFIGARLIYCILEYMGYTGLFKLSFSENLTTPSLLAEYTMLCMGFALYALTKTTRFSRRAVLETLISIGLTVIVAMGDLRLTACCIIAVLLFVILSRSERTLFSIPFIFLLPIAYTVYPNSLFKNIAGVLTVSNSAISPLYGTDLMYIFGVGGIGLILLLAFFLLSMGFKLHSKEQRDAEERGIFAAVSSSLITYACYCVLTGMETHHASALFLAAAAAIAAALGNRGMEKEAADRFREVM